MRIRKHAAKLLLGSACPPPQQYSPPPPPPPPPADEEYDLQSVGDDGLFLCQLNCSPWDVLDSNHYYFQHQHQQEEEDPDEGKGIMGNVLGFGYEEGIFGISEAVTKSSVVVAAEPYLDCKDEDDSDQKKKVKKRRRRKKKENNNDVDDGDDEKTSSVVTVIAKSGGGDRDHIPGICKKNDGKGWHCNRPANPNHTLCDHHLTQLKSYGSSRYNNSNNIAAAAAESEPNATTRAVKNHNKPDQVRSPVVKHRRRKTKAAPAATSVKSDGDGYYYYSGFGLSRGKSRSNFRNEEAKVEEAPVEEVSAGGHNGSDSGDDVSDGPIAGGDLDDDTDDDDEPVGNVDVDNSKGRIRRKKRGRKPIKARSLKSLL